MLQQPRGRAGHLGPQLHLQRRPLWRRDPPDLGIGLTHPRDHVPEGPAPAQEELTAKVGGTRHPVDL